MTHYDSRLDLTLDNLRDILDDKGFFTVTFIKRTTGEERKINGLRNVKKHLAGGPPAYNADDKGLLVVWSNNDVGKNGPNDRGYRSFGYESITQIVVDGRTWHVKDNFLYRVEQ